MKHLDQLTLSLLVDDMLPKQQAEACQKHMDTCPQCEQAFDDLQAMSFALVKMEEVAPPQGFDAMKADILANLPAQDSYDKSKVISLGEGEKKSSLLGGQWQQIAMTLAACLALVFFATNQGSVDNFSQRDTTGTENSATAEGITPRGEEPTEHEEMTMASYPGISGEDVPVAVFDQDDGVAMSQAMEEQLILDAGLREILEGAVCANPYVQSWADMDQAVQADMQMISSLNREAVNFTFLLQELPLDLAEKSLWGSIAEGGEPCLLLLTGETVPAELSEISEIFQAFSEIQTVQVVYFGQFPSA